MRRPSRFLRAALCLALVFLVAHLLGFREQTTVLSGTRVPSAAETFAGLFYTVSWLALVVLAPVLLVAAALRGMASRFLLRASRRRRLAAMGAEDER